LPRRDVRRLCDGAFQARDLVQQLDFRRSAIGVLQNRIRHSQIFGRAEVLVEAQRLAGAGQVVELTLLDRFPDAGLRDAAERHREIVAQLGSSRLRGWRRFD
jgi:hypothetical protein